MGCARERAPGWLAGLAGPGFLLWNLDLLVRSPMGALQRILQCVTERLMRAVLLITHGERGRLMSYGSVR